ncbi:hypothetical protein PV382_06355 [Streptomyces scabiei]|nr:MULTISPECIES: hypothetical protein [Streptomyces]MBP5877381.1 hypothetical protein [Streptomyces sp. LBUM 1477]MDX3080441.1 hypothetical protein [Streptomyces scabiei]MDX3171917.1 hypothetical protein [Streptomyces scabiei]MDX3266605.1 hypothetical protein [Streptomyces scabiei]MDX3389981.1 hypothetical protein [Streptomyces scabiei]
MEPVADDGEDSLNADIQEFAAHERKGGWARALLIARRVTPRTGQGRRTDRQPFSDPKKVHRRVSALEFSRRSGVSAQRVLAFHEAWERAAADGIVRPSAELAPDVEVKLPDEDAIAFFGDNGYYRSYGGHLKKERRQAIENEAERAGVKPTSSIFIAGHPAALTAAVVADATSRSAAQKGLEEFNRRQEQAQGEDRAVAASQAAGERERHLDSQKIPATVETPPDDCARDAETTEVVRAVRAVSKERADPDVALQVFTEMTEIRLGTLRALSLLQRHQVQFTDERSQAIAELCGASQAAMEFIRDLASGPYTALNDEALQAFLDESERKLG